MYTTKYGLTIKSTYPIELEISNGRRTGPQVVNTNHRTPKKLDDNTNIHQLNLHISEMEMSSFWWNCCHWLRRVLSFDDSRYACICDHSNVRSYELHQQSIMSNEFISWLLLILLINKPVQQKMNQDVQTYRVSMVNEFHDCSMQDMQLELFQPSCLDWMTLTVVVGYPYPVYWFLSGTMATNCHSKHYGQYHSCETSRPVWYGW